MFLHSFKSKLQKRSSEDLLLQKKRDKKYSDKDIERNFHFPLLCYIFC